MFATGGVRHAVQVAHAADNERAGVGPWLGSAMCSKTMDRLCPPPVAITTRRIAWTQCGDARCGLGQEVFGKRRHALAHKAGLAARVRDLPTLIAVALPAVAPAPPTGAVAPPSG